MHKVFKNKAQRCSTPLSLHILGSELLWPKVQNSLNPSFKENVFTSLNCFHTYIMKYNKMPISAKIHKCVRKFSFLFLIFLLTLLIEICKPKEKKRKKQKQLCGSYFSVKEILLNTIWNPFSHSCLTYFVVNWPWYHVITFVLELNKYDILFCKELFFFYSIT